MPRGLATTDDASRKRGGWGEGMGGAAPPPFGHPLSIQWRGESGACRGLEVQATPKRAVREWLLRPRIGRGGYGGFPAPSPLSTRWRGGWGVRPGETGGWMRPPYPRPRQFRTKRKFRQFRFPRTPCFYLDRSLCWNLVSNPRSWEGCDCTQKNEGGTDRFPGNRVAWNFRVVKVSIFQTKKFRSPPLQPVANPPQSRCGGRSGPGSDPIAYWGPAPLC